MSENEPEVRIVRRNFGEIPETSPGEWARIGAIPDEDIDYSDIPERTNMFRRPPTQRVQMTTETIEVEELTTASPEEETPSVEVREDLNCNLDEELEIARAESEGMTAMPPPAVQPADPEEEDEDAVAIKIALAEMYETQDKLSAAISDHAAKARTAKAAKERVETLQEDFYGAVTRLRDCNKPLPLFARPKPDPAKAEIDAMFPSPVAIPPLPADDIDEFFRRKRRDTRLDSLGLTTKVDEILKAAGYATILDLDKIFEASADLVTINVPNVGSITEKRQESILDAIAIKASEWKAEWSALHPAESLATEEAAD